MSSNNPATGNELFFVKAFVNGEIEWDVARTWVTLPSLRHEYENTGKILKCMAKIRQPIMTCRGRIFEAMVDLGHEEIINGTKEEEEEPENKSEEPEL